MLVWVPKTPAQMPDSMQPLTPDYTTYTLVTPFKLTFAITRLTWPVPLSCSPRCWLAVGATLALCYLSIKCTTEDYKLWVVNWQGTRRMYGFAKKVGWIVHHTIVVIVLECTSCHTGYGPEWPATTCPQSLTVFIHFFSFNYLSTFCLPCSVHVLCPIDQITQFYYNSALPSVWSVEMSPLH